MGPVADPRSDVEVDAVPAASGRSAARRVTEVHAQTRRGLVVALGFVVAAALTAVVRGADGWWLALHLFAVGGLLSAIAATTQMLAVTWSAAPAPSPVAASAQRSCLAAGTIALVAGREAGWTWLFVAGGGAVVVAMVVLALLLLRIRAEAVTPRFAPAIEAYVMGVVTGSVGMSFGVALGAGWAGSRAAQLRDAHLVLNVLGLIGLVVAGTLPYFSATQVRRKMSPWATPRAMRATFLALGAAVIVAACGRLLDRAAVVGFGLSLYAAGLGVVLAMLPVHGRGRLQWAGPRAVQMLCGLAWWMAMTVALAVAAVRRSPDTRIIQALVLGGFAQILVASLAYLGPVLRGGGHQRLTAGFAATRSWVSLGAGNAAAAAALTGFRPGVAVGLLVWTGDVVWRAGRLVTAR